MIAIKYTHATLNYEGGSSQTGTSNFTGIKRDASVAVLHTVVSGKCVLLLIGGAHAAGQSRDR
jgi:hydrogenase maturation factor